MEGPQVKDLGFGRDDGFEGAILGLAGESGERGEDFGFEVLMGRDELSFGLEFEVLWFGEE